jgi:uncharacterized repeat protein (TIGR03803 family)
MYMAFAPVRNKRWFGKPEGAFMCSRRSALNTVLLLATMATTIWASAQTESTVFSFTVSDAFWPQGGLVADSLGNLYGTTKGGGTYGVGTVYELSPPAPGSTTWTKTTLYSFQSYGTTGNIPSSDLTIDSTGALYGTTYVGGDSRCVCGVIYKLVPPAQKGGAWTEQVLHAFTSGGIDGRLPNAAVALNSQGIIYGVTQQGGAWDSGVLYQIRPGSGGTFVETVLYSFGNIGDASTPNGPLVMDSTGALYGVTSLGGAFNQGTVVKFVPPARAGQQGTESILFSFGGGSLSSGITPVGNLIFDSAGNLYGVTYGGGGSLGFGVVYQLTPASGSWAENVLFSFNGTNGRYPQAGLTLNPTNGSIYGTNSAGNALKGGSGIVFQLSPPAVVGQAWTETTLYQFTFLGNGGLPAARILRDSSGNLYGTTLNGGLYGCDGYCGVVYQIAP